MKSNKSLSLFGVVCVFLIGYQFMGAAVWTSPSVAPPNGNTDAPVNIGTVTQTKTGNLVANIFAASSHMRSDLYCDALGGNCFSPSTIDIPIPPVGTMHYGGVFTQRGSCGCSGGWCSSSATVTCGFTTVSCTNPNPATGACTCPAGFASHVTTPISTVSCSKSGDSDTICGTAAPLRITHCYRM